MLIIARGGQSLLHEVEVHAGRAIRGKKLGTGLAGYGLPGYLEFEEPFAVSVEDSFEQRQKPHGENYTLGIALATGYVGTERDFRDTFELLWRINAIVVFIRGKDTTSAIEKARETAYTNLVRLWRGMPTDEPGCVFPKDRAYDNQEVWQYLAPSGHPLPRQDFLRLLQAKYDPRQVDQNIYL